MDSLTLAGLTMATNSGLLTATGAVTTYDTTVAIEYMIGGKFGTALAAVTTGATPPADANGVTLATLTADQGCILVWGVNAAGTVQVMQGETQAIDGDSDLFLKEPQFPALPADFCPFAYQVLKTTGAAGVITIGTSNWDATGFSNAIVNIGVLPDRPQVD